MSVQSGLDVLVAEDFARLAGRRVGLLTNPSAVDRTLVSAYRRLTGAPQVDARALFGPEHGIAGAAAEGAHVGSGADPRTGLPVHSLYGKTLRPTSAMLDGLDVLVCDIQDIGVRFYTYTWTVSHVLEAAGEHGVAVLLLDRPNPLGGVRIEGPLLEGSQASFVGRFGVPVRHGMTLGELAGMINALWNPTPAELEIVPCDGWQRDMTWTETCLPWVPPSPNMPQLATLQHYPGSCLLEGTNLSEGRGTALPFEVVGAPWIDGEALVDALYGAGLERMGAGFLSHTFKPSASKWRGRLCQGVQVHVTDTERWRAIPVWLGVIATVRALYPRQFKWKTSHFDRLAGTTWMRRQIEQDVAANRSPDVTIATLDSEWHADCGAFDIQRQPYLLYGTG